MKQKIYFAHIMIARNCKPGIVSFCVIARVLRNETMTTLKQRIDKLCERGNAIFEHSHSFFCHTVEIEKRIIGKVDGILDWTGGVR